jgi:hypothetical protein
MIKYLTKQLKSNWHLNENINPIHQALKNTGCIKMIRSIFPLFNLFCLIFSTNIQAQPLEPTGRRLREIVANKYADGNIIWGGRTL